MLISYHPFTGRITGQSQSSLGGMVITVADADLPADWAAMWASGKYRIDPATGTVVLNPAWVPPVIP
jgi:hypothetical protein